MSDINILNGFDRFHLMTAAAEIHRLRRLNVCFTGFCAGETWRTICGLTGLHRHGKIRRLMDRRLLLPAARLQTMPVLEAMGFLGRRLGNEPVRTIARHMFAHRVARALPRCGGRLLHYRSGFGHDAVRRARAAGMITLCDHSIAHPATIEPLIEHQGTLPRHLEQPRPNALWQDVLADFRGATAVLVCSDFVKQTFLHQGWNPDRLHVVQYGVDDDFVAHLDRLPGNMRADPSATLRIMFAGSLSRRKGFDGLVQALTGLMDLRWTLKLAGSTTHEIMARHGAFLADPRVRQLGEVSRKDLARHLAQTDLFLFPSLVEGSARVVFDALAAGCVVVTTPNAGSIVEDRVHGLLIPPGDVAAIQAAVRRVAADPVWAGSIGRRNALEIRQHWRQTHYGARLVQLYDRLLEHDARLQVAADRKSAMRPDCTAAPVPA